VWGRTPSSPWTGENVDPANATRSEFRLSGRWRLTPSDISGETRNLGLSTPIVFMNACQVAQGSMALSGIGGWAVALTRAGAGAFVGTHWNVRDDLAHQFATAFYNRLVGGATLAGAVREARQALLARIDGDATWLAYTVHASPGASCKLAAPAA
jgi:CHAT domain-containing protein